MDSVYGVTNSGIKLICLWLILCVSAEDFHSAESVEIGGEE